MSRKAGGTDHLFLFTYANDLLCERIFLLIFSIYLFISSKWCPMSTKAGGTDHVFLFTYANHLLCDRVFVLIFSIDLFIYSKWCQQNKIGARLCFYIEISGSRRNMYGWQAGGMHPTAMLSYLLIKIGCCDLFLEIYFLKSIFIKRTSFGTISWTTLGQCCKIPTCKQKGEINWMSSWKLIFEFNIFWRLNSKLLWVH